MVIIQDSREKEPLTFESDGFITGTKVAAMPYGDYGCEYTSGWQPPFVFERKSLGDLFGTMTSGYKRFKREVNRASKAKVRIFVIVEASLTTVMSGYKHSSFDGRSMVQKLYTLKVRHDIETIFCESRSEMVCHIVEFYKAIGRHYAAKRPIGICEKTI